MDKDKLDSILENISKNLRNPLRYYTDGTCFICTSHKVREGTTMIVQTNPYVNIKKAILEAAGGVLANDERIFHKCKNKACLNPSHYVIMKLGEYEKKVKESDNSNRRRSLPRRENVKPLEPNFRINERGNIVLKNSLGLKRGSK